MTTLESTGLELGIEQIDQQHSRFFVLMNRMITAGPGPANRELVAQVLEELTDYLDEHFRTEEELMAQVGYPDLMEHHRQHAAFVAKVIAFSRKFRREEVGLEDEMTAFLVEWFMDHIRHEDAKYVSLFRDNGIT